MSQVEHTRTERAVLGYLRHPFIVGLEYAFQTPDKLYFVLDYCAGGELFFHLGKLGKFSESRACFYAAQVKSLLFKLHCAVVITSWRFQISLALIYIHQFDIIYRDLKPENVLLDERGYVKLTDFGLSKERIKSKFTGAHSFCGTPEYLGTLPHIWRHHHLIFRK
jgi:RAC serine/threonine-protein kinase